jgi:cell division protease FtsH
MAGSDELYNGVMTEPTPAVTPTNRRTNPLWPSGWIILGTIGLLAVLLLLFDRPARIGYSEFQSIVEAGQLKKLAIVGTDRAIGEVKDKNAEVVKAAKVSGEKFTVNVPDPNNSYKFLEYVEAAEKEYREKAGVPSTERLVITREEDPLPYVGPILWFAFLMSVMAAFFFLVVLPRIREPGGAGFINSYIRSPARRYEKGKSKITFDDVAGMEASKRELQEVVEFLKDANQFTRLGAQVPKGVLLVGPPGTGKTLLAKAVAGEANVPFYSINGSEFIQMFVGVGASRVRDLFKTAKDNAPCVIFIDEIDAVGRMRGAGVGGGSDEREQTLNQILSEMDGFSPNETVIVLAATNRPDVLDSALLRPGRFDRHVTVDKPTWQGRLAILKVHTKTKPLSDDVDLEKIARGMIGMSGADLRNLCNEAALLATRKGKNRIEKVDFDRAADRVLLGANRDEMPTKDEQRRTAYHEAGHALTAFLDPKADQLTRVSIVPRGRSGGVTLFAPDEDRLDLSASELKAKLIVYLGGRAADRIVFGEAMSGAMQDLKQATRVARLMVTQFGMSDRLGPVSYRAGEEHVFLGKEIADTRDFSEGTARIIDEEIQRILGEAETMAIAILEKHRTDLDRLAAALLVHEELDRDQVERLMKGLILDPPSPTAERPSDPAVKPMISPVPEADLPPRLGFAGA